MYAHEYRSRVFELVAEIGKLVQVNTALYVYSNSENIWRSVNDAASLEKYVHQPYGFTTPDGKNFHAFAVATVGQDRRPGGHGLLSMITSFKLYYFPGCCALAISSGAMVYPPYMYKGVNRLGIQLRIALAGAYNYAALVCTDTTLHPASLRTIEGAKFTKLHSLKNKRTNNTVNIYLKELE